ncbi:MAG: hypothetical protein K2X66_06745 [Cyanobacteria bacterium]|nr:hypothetical protein [Cyanobacteriota bacterium]
MNALTANRFPISQETALNGRKVPRKDPRDIIVYTPKFSGNPDDVNAVDAPPTRSLLRSGAKKLLAGTGLLIGSTLLWTTPVVKPLVERNIKWLPALLGLSQLTKIAGLGLMGWGGLNVVRSAFQK